MKSRRTFPSSSSAGFSTLEMVLSMALFLIIAVSVLSLVADLQKTFVGTQDRISAQAQARSALSLMAAELELAGSNLAVDTVLSGAVGPCTTPCSVSVQSGAGLALNDHIIIGTGADYEPLLTSAACQPYITSVSSNSFTVSCLANAHVANEPVIYPGYPYVTGIRYPNCGSSTCTDTKLAIYGNILGNGTIYFVEYKFDSTNHWITRSETPVTQATINPAYVLCENVQAASFMVYQDDQGNYASGSISLTVQTPYQDPQTKQFQTVTLERGVVQARNIQLANRIESGGNVSSLPPEPAGVATLVSQ
jgi:type II secretory pathway pseudopilin PulG